MSTSEQWREIEKLYHAALERGPAALDGAREDVRREVQSLLDQGDAGLSVLSTHLNTTVVGAEAHLHPGLELGPYTIESALGAGGMGEVWKARDTRLDRTVAIKTCRAQFTDRFQREARAVAALNHPHVAALYDIGVSPAGLGYIVLEYVDGLTLAERIRQGPIAEAEALTLARQIAEAIEAAHEKGIVHRDLKPANIKIASDGSLKVLDFGLAKALDTGSASTPAETSSVARTQLGMVLGTPAYMAPEQALGRSADRRVDVWQFGAIVGEMLTGKRLFPGETSSEVLAAVIKDNPKLDGIPPRWRSLVERCLTKDPRRRLQAIGEARILLEDGLPLAAQATSVGSNRGVLAWSALATVAAIALGAFILFRIPTAEPRTIRLTMLPPENVRISPASFPMISPAGGSVVFSAETDGTANLWLRDLDSGSARLLAGTDDAIAPFWSPDSKFVAFSAHDKLKRIELSSGTVVNLCDALHFTVGSWSSRDTILFGTRTGSGLFSVPAAGGTATVATMLDHEVSHAYPWFLPDGHHFLYTALKNGLSSLYIADLDASDAAKGRREIQKLQGVTLSPPAAAYSAPGFLLFTRDQSLMAEPFEPNKGQILGEATVVAEGLNVFSVSQTGILTYGIVGNGSAVQLAWLDRTGKHMGTVGQPGGMNWPAISPDGTRVAHEVVDPRGRSVDVWVHDLASGKESRFTFGPRISNFPIWSPDSLRIAYQYVDQVAPGLHVKTADGTGGDILDGRLLDMRADDWSRDGKYIFEEVADPKTNNDIWVIPMTNGKPGPSVPYLQSSFNEAYAKLSPDGRWLAYTSDQANRNEVFVREFALPADGKPVSGDAQWQISTAGGSRPVWSRDGRELFYIGADRTMMTVEIKSGASFNNSAPKALFPTQISRGGLDYWFDVAKDGRFLMPIHPDRAVTEPMTVVLNWMAGLKK